MDNESPKDGIPSPPNWILENISEVSKICSGVFAVYVSFLLYCGLTALSITDRQLILNDVAHLPLLNVGVSLTAFFVLTPITAIILFLYLQIYVHRLKGLLDDLRDKYAPLVKLNCSTSVAHRLVNTLG
jgi:hypothetical protein